MLCHCRYTCNETTGRGSCAKNASGLSPQDTEMLHEFVQAFFSLLYSLQNRGHKCASHCGVIIS